jgi:hypothetical protein
MSQQLLEILGPLSQPCKKLQSLKYRLPKTPIKTLSQLEKLLQRPLTLIPYEQWSTLLQPNHRFETVFPGDPRPEQRFRAREINGRALVVGPLKEIYHAKIHLKFIRLNETKLSEFYCPVNEERKCVVVTPSVYKDIPGAGRSFKTVRTGWGATHIVRPGDVLILEEKGVYRIHKDVFKSTYQINM